MSVKSRIATGVGLLLFFGGLALLALGVPTRRGVGYELVFGQGASIPGWAYLLSFTVGPLLAIVGAVVGMRYGNFERYHKDYNPETGAIDSDHPFAALQERISKPGDIDPSKDHPEKFVFKRSHLAILITALIGPPTVYLYVQLDFAPMMRWMTVFILGGGGLGMFFFLDYLFQKEEMDYDASW